jgi:hypothetical protein
MSEPIQSVVIAAWPDLAGLEECLAALAPQHDESTEILVVATREPSAELTMRFPRVRWFEAASDRLIPHLWGLGIAQSRGEVIAITTSHFIPAPDWVAVVRQAHARLEAPAIGGRIEPSRSGSAVDWATFFLRYSFYLRYDHEQDAPDLAGDNASYKRAALANCPDLPGKGFWELDLHKQLRAEGRRLVFVPEMRVTQRRSFGFAPFLRQRFLHGTHFGRSRFRGRAAWLRAVGVLASPLIPVVFLSKIVGRVARSGRDYWPFFRALPVLICFLLAWSLGETVGYLLPSLPEESPSRTEGQVPESDSSSRSPREVRTCL